MRHSTLSQFDARTPVLGDHIAANIWLTMHAHAQDAVITALADVITPNERRRVGRFVVSNHFHTFFERLLDGVIDNAGLIVVDLNTILVQDHLITVNIAFDVKADQNSCCMTKSNLIASDCSSARPTLNIHSTSFTAENSVVCNVDLILWQRFNHNTTALKVS